jgi:hypothetical protein
MLSIAWPVMVDSQRLSARRLTRIHAAMWMGATVRNSGNADARTAAPTATTEMM